MPHPKLRPVDLADEGEYLAGLAHSPRFIDETIANAKHMLNGPCGSSTSEHCEVAADKPCAWQLIFKRLQSIGQLDRLEKIHPPKDWSKAWHRRRKEDRKAGAPDLELAGRKFVVG